MGTIPQRDMSQRRVKFLDVARGIGIVCVLLGHNLWSQSRASAIIFNFHMPLFYFLSGVLFSSEKYGVGQLAVAWKKTIGMLITSLFFSALACISFVVNPELMSRISRRTLFLFFVHGEPWYDKPLWFLVSLAFVFFVFSLVSDFLSNGGRFARRSGFLILCIALCFLSARTYASFRTFWSPMMVATVPFGLFWFALGHFSANFVRHLEVVEIAGGALVCLVGVFAMLLFVGTDFSTKPDIRTARMGSWLLFPRSMCGIAAVILLVRLIPHFLWKPLAFIGENSIVFFTMEFATFPFVSKFLGFFVPQYGHFHFAEHTALWQSLLAVGAQLIVLSAITPVVLCLLGRFRQVSWGKLLKASVGNLAIPNKRGLESA